MNNVSMSKYKNCKTKTQDVANKMCLLEKHAV